MRLHLLVSAVFLIGVSASASGQLLSDRPDGLSRICTYAGNPGITSGAVLPQQRVPIGENCPVTPRPPTGSMPAPPSAQLRSETLSADRRSCSYEQGGGVWSFELPASQTCPLYAGMIQTQRLAPIRPLFAPPPPQSEPRGR